MKKSITIITTLILIGCGKGKDLNLPYDCHYNTLPDWMKHVIIIEAMVFNIIVLALIVTLIALKYQLYKLEKNERN